MALPTPCSFTRISTANNEGRRSFCDAEEWLKNHLTTRASHLQRDVLHRPALELFEPECRHVS
jgi:hypothetical protein